MRGDSSNCGTQELLLYGGEFYDGKQDKMRVFGDVFLYNIQQSSWTHVLIPNRCRACACHGA